MRSARELSKSLLIPVQEVEDICLHFLSEGIFIEVEHIQPTKYKLNPAFNQDKKPRIDVTYPTKQML